MNILVVGYGLVGGQRVQALTRNPAVSSITVCEPKIAAGTEVSAKAKVVEAEAAFSRAYQAAVVATPHDTAVELLPRVLKLAPAVLTEKPLGRCAAEASRLVAEAEEAKSRLFVGFNYRFLRNIRPVRSLLATGELGKVLAVDAVLSHGAQPGYEKSWKTDPARCGGGVCIDPGVHLFDLLNWFFGPAELVGGWLSRLFWPIPVEDHASLILRLPSGAVASVFLSLSSWRSRMELTIETEGAQILVRGRGKFYGPQQLTIAPKWPWLRPQEARETEYDYGIEDTSFPNETDEFIAVAGGASTGGTLASAEDGLRAMQIVDDCYRKLPPPQPFG
jgi:predicted dehydrogenase